MYLNFYSDIIVPQVWDLVGFFADPNHLDADPGPACDIDADPYPACDEDADPDSAYDYANPDPLHCLQIRLLWFGNSVTTF